MKNSFKISGRFFSAAILCLFMAVCGWGFEGDIYSDGVVGWDDLSAMGEKWLSQSSLDNNWGGWADIDHSNSVDGVDFSIMANSWGATIPADSNLVLWWSFDQNSGGTVLDKSGHGNDGTIFGSADFVDGVVGNSLDFDGLDDWIERAYPDDLPCAGDDSWTINLFLKVPVQPESTQWIGGWGKGAFGGWTGTGTSERWITYGVIWASDPPVMTTHFWTYDSGSIQWPKESLDIGNWQMLTVTYDGVMLRVYKNGQLMSKKDKVLLPSVAKLVCLGREMGWSGAGNALLGQVDEFMIWDYALCAGEIGLLLEPFKASRCEPFDRESGIDVNGTLKWKTGAGANSHDVYLGENQQEVDDANNSCSCFKGNFGYTHNYYKPADLQVGRIYYWRVDEVCQGVRIKGDVWQFTTAMTANSMIVWPQESTIGKYEALFVDVLTSYDYDNPFNPDEIKVDAVVTVPDGNSLVVPGFYYSGQINGARWQVRFAPRETGVYNYYIKLYKNGSVVEQSLVFIFNVTESGRDGFLRVNPDSLYTLKHDSGKRFRGVGNNKGGESFARIASNGRPFSYDNYFEMLDANNCNFVRVWMSCGNKPIEWIDYGLGRYNLVNAERWDEVIELAEEHGLYLMIAFDSGEGLHKELSYWNCGDEWKNNPYNVVLGGPCAEPVDFFMNAAAKEYYKKRLRYIVARWGYSPNVCMWELWNELNQAVNEMDPNVAEPASIAWHDEMAGYLKSIDPFGHIVTTSTSSSYPGELWEVDDIDLTQTHYYYESSANMHDRLEDFGETYGRPHVLGEFAYSWHGPGEIGHYDEYNRELHLGLWRGMFSPTPVLPLTWWVEFFDEQGQFYNFDVVSNFCQEMLADNNDVIIENEIYDDGLDGMSLKVGERVFCWFYNDTTRRDFNVTIYGLDLDTFQYRYYDTTSGDWSVWDYQLLTRPYINLNLSLDPGEDIAIEIERSPIDN